MSMQSTDQVDAPVKRLSSNTIGDPARAHVVLVHGFTQTAESWRWVARQLASSFLVTTVDLPGHGGSSEVRVGSIEQTADLLASTADRAIYIGYSLGGRVCLELAVRQPRLVDALVLVSTSPGIKDDAERELRRQSDDALAERLDPSDPDAPRVEMIDFLHDWLSQPLFARLDAAAADLGARLVNTPEGLAHSLRTAGVGHMAPLHNELQALEMPILAIAGSLDTKYRDIAQEMVQQIGSNATLEIVEGSGHAVHFEHHEAFYDALRSFLTTTRV